MSTFGSKENFKGFVFLFSFGLFVIEYIPTIHKHSFLRTSNENSEAFSFNDLNSSVSPIGMLNRVAVRDFYVADLDGDTLLYVKRVDAYIASLASLAKKNLVINYGNVQGGKFVVRETDRGTIAVKEITDKLVNRERKGEFRLNIHSLDGSGIDFQLLRKDEPREGVDYADMRLLGIDVHIDDFLLDRGAVSGDIRNLSFMERSGFKLDNLLGYFYVYDGRIEVKNAQLKTALSQINLDSLLLDGKDWLEYRDFINKIPIICSVTDSDISSEDVGYFAPALWGWQTKVRNSSLLPAFWLWHSWALAV